MNKYLRYLGYLITLFIIIYGSIIIYKKYELPHQDDSKGSNMELSSEDTEKGE